MSRFFVNRPIVAIVIAIVTVVGGLVAMRSLPIAQFPDIIPPQIIVSANYIGADALTIEQAVATSNVTVSCIVPSLAFVDCM